MPNIQFNYLYRCSGNYKKFTSVVFANPDNIELTELENLIKSKLIHGEYFYAEQWHLPKVFIDRVDFRIDPTWHEFENLVDAAEETNATFDLDKFLRAIDKPN